MGNLSPSWLWLNLSRKWRWQHHRILMSRGGGVRSHDYSPQAPGLKSKTLRKASKALKIYSDFGGRSLNETRPCYVDCRRHGTVWVQLTFFPQGAGTARQKFSAVCPLKLFFPIKTSGSNIPNIGLKNILATRFSSYPQSSPTSLGAALQAGRQLAQPPQTSPSGWQRRSASGRWPQTGCSPLWYWTRL